MIDKRIRFAKKQNELTRCFKFTRNYTKLKADRI